MMELEVDEPVVINDCVFCGNMNLCDDLFVEEDVLSREEDGDEGKGGETDSETEMGVTDKEWVESE